MYTHGIGRMPGRAERRGRHRPDRLVGPPSGWPGQERGEVGAHRHGADARSAAAVGDAERLVQVEVADVGAEPARPGEADERVEVGAVDVHLAAVVVDDGAQLADARLEHAVRRRVGDHDRRRARRRPRRPWPAGRRGRRCRASSQATTTTLIPAITALAALVPWALDGIRQTVRSLVAAAAVVGRGSPAARRTRPGCRRSAAG